MNASTDVCHSSIEQLASMLRSGEDVALLAAEEIERRLETAPRDASDEFVERFERDCKREPLLRRAFGMHRRAIARAGRPYAIAADHRAWRAVVAARASTQPQPSTAHAAFGDAASSCPQPPLAPFDEPAAGKR